MRLITVITFVVWTILLAGETRAQGFGGGIPAGWTCTGNCGASGANGVVTAPPTSSSYGWVSTLNGQTGVALDGVGGVGVPTNGSILKSITFNAAAGDELAFQFNYITSDGAGFADYAWARLLDGSGIQVALLYTARTTIGASVTPGFAMPTPAATLTPSSTGIIPGGPLWAPLGANSGQCYSTGCGYSGWILSQFQIPVTGAYSLEFGVTNWNDTAFQSGMAFDGITVAGVPVIPEPQTYAMLIIGLAITGLQIRRLRRT